MVTRPAHLYESATFWALVGGAIAVIGLGLMAVGVAQDVASSRPDLWANWWFRIGFALLLVGAGMLAWALILFLASRRSGPGEGTTATAPPTLPAAPPVASFTISEMRGDIHVHGEGSPKSASEPPNDVKPKGFDAKASYFSHQTIRITDFPLENEIFLRGKTFEHCIIQGPALVALGRSVELSESGFSAPHPDTLVWAAPAEDKPVDCVIVLDACAFRRCSFTKIGVVVPKEYFEKFRDALTGKIRGFDIGNKGQLTDL